MKYSLPLVFALSFFLLATPPALYALDITVTPDGSVELYSDTILGVDSETDTATGRYPEKIIRPVQKQEIRIKPDKNSLQVETLQRTGKNKELLERTDTDRLQLNLPAHQTEEQRRLEMAKQRTGNSDTSVIELKRQIEEKAQVRELELSKLTPEERQKRQLFYETQKEERQERTQEKIELKNNIGTDGQELNLESRGVRAALRDKALTIDPETNSLILTTKDGTERVLTTLPDQAVERMLEVKGLRDVDTESVTVEEEDGRLKYVARARRIKKLFGLFERPVETELSVDDQSGEVTETSEEKPTLIGRFLDRVSF